MAREIEILLYRTGQLSPFSEEYLDAKDYR